LVIWYNLQKTDFIKIQRPGRCHDIPRSGLGSFAVEAVQPPGLHIYCICILYKTCFDTNYIYKIWIVFVILGDILHINCTYLYSLYIHIYHYIINIYMRFKLKSIEINGTQNVYKSKQIKSKHIYRFVCIHIYTYIMNTYIIHMRIRKDFPVIKRSPPGAVKCCDLPLRIIISVHMFVWSKVWKENNHSTIEKWMFICILF
jgi:hypothetical protein